MRTPPRKVNDPIPALKAELARIIVERLAGWAQAYAACFLKTDQPRVSDLRKGKLDRFSLEQLIRFVSRIEGTVTFNVTWSDRRRWIGPPS